jgi:UDP-N-acetylmuramoyl-L-alanyl-D-glutamate--2,6-diaminopimelate ligase
MRLDELCRRLSGTPGPADIVVGGITHDSRKVLPGWVFAALPGAHHHGLDFLDQAIAAGAVAVLTDRPANAPPVPWLVSDNPRRDMAIAAWEIAGHPERELTLVGVTGTNGKSTTAHLVHEILEASGTTSGCLGTVGHHLPGQILPADRTTPESTDLAPILRALLDRGGRAVAMEVSSIALAQHRLHGLQFAAATFTNLSRDHLDLHGDLETYFACKRRLFDEHLAPDGRRVLPVDDPWAARLLEHPRSGDITWGLGAGTVRAVDVASDLDGTRFVLDCDGRSAAVQLPLLGRHNLLNAIAAAATAHALDVPVDGIRSGLDAARPLPGRMERVPVDRPYAVFVDYAHTPDGLRAALESLRALGGHRLIVVFGAGGDRDPGKRRPMGRAVGATADLAIVTSDNPRSEDPEAIAAEVAAGVHQAGSEPVVVLDRADAIALALERAGDDDVVVVAGKGHENEQIIGDRVTSFSDREVILERAAGVTG